MKIGLSYINGTNHGDQIIYFTAKYLVEKSLKENGVKDYEIIPVDICLVDNPQEEGARYRRTKFKFERKLREKAKKKLFYYFEKKIPVIKSPKKQRKMLLKKWHLTKTCRRFYRTELPKLNDLDLMIFSGGGIIKYHQQYFHFLLNDITNICQKNNVPVLINAAGIEGFDATDPECQLLIEALNRDCVKYVSTRDDYNLLKEKYIKNPNIQIEAVCDPAFWTKERYRITVPDKKEKKVGLNAIRPNIFGDYLYEVDIHNLEKVYYELIKRLLDAGYKVELFSNGVKADGAFFDELMEKYPELKQEKRNGNISIFLPAQPRRLIKRIASYERFMAVRLHASIVGTALGVPNISLVWCVKQLLFGQQTGTIDNFITKENFNVDYIFEKLMEAKPYCVSLQYKNSVYDGINEQIKKYVWGRLR